VLLAVVVVTLIAIARADHQGPGTDFWVYWSTGRNFAHGQALYTAGIDNRDFIYPPFAAQVFQLFALLPLKVAAALFYVLSVALWGLAAWLTRDIVARLQPPPRRRTTAMVLALILSGQFVLNNLNLTQINLVVFVLSLVAIRGIVRARPAAIGWAVVAAWLKITPVFVVFWGAARGGRRAVTTAVVVSLLCLFLPILQRGPSQGVADLHAYYQAFLGEFASGKVVTTYTNQNLAALVYRAVIPGPPDDRYQYAYLPSLQAYATPLYHGLVLLVLTVFVARVLWLAWRRTRITALEVAGVFLTSHLVSGITWKAHLVSMLFVFYAFLVVDVHSLSAARRWALWASWFGIGLIGLVGRDIFGNTVHHYMGGYSVFVWVMLWLWIWTGGLRSPRLTGTSP
jgi:hypothetical protein